MKFIAPLSLAALLLGGVLAPASAAEIAATGWMADLMTVDTFGDDIEKRRKPRIPGGSGCDDPEDVIEHPECRV